MSEVIDISTLLAGVRRVPRALVPVAGAGSVRLVPQADGC